MTTVGAAIRVARSARGWSQETLAEVLGCDSAAVSRLETGKRGLSIRMSLKLAAAFGGEARAWRDLDLARVMALPPKRRPTRANVAKRAVRRTTAPLVVDGRSYAVPEAVIAAARAVYRSARIEGEGHGVSVAVDGRALWALGTALDAQDDGRNREAL